MKTITSLSATKYICLSIKKKKLPRTKIIATKKLMKFLKKKKYPTFVALKLIYDKG